MLCILDSHGQCIQSEPVAQYPQSIPILDPQHVNKCMNTLHEYAVYTCSLIHPFTHPFSCPHIHCFGLHACLLAHPLICLQPTCLPAHMPVRPQVHLPTHLSIWSWGGWYESWAGMDVLHICGTLNEGTGMTRAWGEAQGEA